MECCTLEQNEISLIGKFHGHMVDVHSLHKHTFHNDDSSIPTQHYLMQKLRKNHILNFRILSTSFNSNQIDFLKLLDFGFVYIFCLTIDRHHTIS